MLWSRPRRRKLIRSVCYGDVLMGLLTGATITIATAVHQGRPWNRTDTVAVGLVVLAVALFIPWRRVSPQRDTWRCGSVAVGAGVALVLLLRKWPLVWTLGLAAFLLCGLALRTKPIAEPLAARDLLPVVVLAGSALVTLAVVEGTLRLVPSLLSPGARLQVEERRVPAWYVPHSYIGHLNRPLRQSRDPWGFRNPWPWPTPVDILAVGDSFTYGYLVGDQQAWPARLAQALAPRTVINLGLIGAAPQQYLRLYETFGLALRPKVLLVGIFLGNDVWGAKEFERWWRAGGWGRFPTFGERSTPQACAGGFTAAGIVCISPPSGMTCGTPIARAGCLGGRASCSPRGSASSWCPAPLR
jgi:hypothetical protein